MKYLITSYLTVTTNRAPVFTSLPEMAGQIVGAVVIHDARPAIVEQFLHQYGSPLAPYSAALVQTADKYDIDYRLLPAIAMQESGGGKIIPDYSYNAWGFGIHERGTLRFSSWEQSMDAVARGLRRDYIAIGLVTPEQIMTKYTPASIEKGGTWAKGVRFFMEQMP